MAATIELRADYGVDGLRWLAEASRDAWQTRRLLALAVIYDGGSRAEAARVGGVGLQIVRDWVCGPTRKARTSLWIVKRRERRRS